MVVPIETLLGFGLLSASISWLLLIHPAIARRRTLAYEIALLRKAEAETGIPVVRLDVEAADQPSADPRRSDLVHGHPATRPARSGRSGRRGGDR